MYYYKNESDKNKIISKCIIPLIDLQQGITKELKNQMAPCGLIHLFLQINKNNEEPFQDMQFLSSSNPYMTLYVKVIVITYLLLMQLDFQILSVF